MVPTPAGASLIFDPRAGTNEVEKGGGDPDVNRALLLAAMALLLARPAPSDVAARESLVTVDTRLLVVAPHPDDAVLGAGGLIQRVLHRQGAVRVIVVTSGDGFVPGVALETHKAHPQADDFRAYARLREREAIRGLGVLGVGRNDIDFLGFPDRGLC